MPASRNLLPYLQLVRAPALFTAVSNIVAAYLIVGWGPGVAWGALAALIGASACLYSAGMVLNDYFDLREDAKERPHRPLPSGRVTITTAWRLGWLLLATGLALAALNGSVSLWIAALLATLILLYNTRLKHTWAGGLAMGGCRYLNWLLGLSIAPLSVPLLALPVPVLLYVSALTVLSSEETQARRAQAIVTCAFGLILAAVSLAWLHGLGVLPRLEALAAAGAALAWLLYQLYQTRRHFTAPGVQHMVKMLLLGIIPLDALLVLGAGPWWGALIVLALLIPARLLARMMYIT